MKIETRCVQAGVRFDKQFGAISTPIYQSSTFRHPAIGENFGYDYSRTGNPTRRALEDAVAGLEKGMRSFAFSSGMAAITSTLLLFSSGDHLVASDDLYGGTYRLLVEVFERFGLHVTFVDTTDPAQVEAAIEESTRAVFIETPSNPLMKITDLAAISTLAKKRGLLTIVDNTFMTPYLQRPLLLGADIIIHSGTKFLGGHNDLLAGLVVARDPELVERLAVVQNTTGADLGPMDSWLLIRGIKTLAVRMDRCQSNALKLAQWLTGQSEVTKVHYPGLPEHPGHLIGQKQASGFGAMISFTVTDFALAKKILSRVKLITFAESLGGVETLITHPGCQTHKDVPEEKRLQLGITDNLLRLSVGIEDPDDLIADLEGAMRE